MSNPQGGRISEHMYPFYRVFDDKGEQYCDCSHEEYAIRTVELHACLLYTSDAADDA